MIIHCLYALKNWELFFKANNSNAVKECLRFVFNIDQIDKPLKSISG